MSSQLLCLISQRIFQGLKIGQSNNSQNPEQSLKCLSVRGPGKSVRPFSALDVSSRERLSNRVRVVVFFPSRTKTPHTRRSPVLLWSPTFERYLPVGL